MRHEINTSFHKRFERHSWRPKCRKKVPLFVCKQTKEDLKASWSKYFGFLYPYLKIRVITFNINIVRILTNILHIFFGKLAIFTLILKERSGYGIISVTIVYFH